MCVVLLSESEGGFVEKESAKGSERGESCWKRNAARTDDSLGKRRVNQIFMARPAREILLERVHSNDALSPPLLGYGVHDFTKRVWCDAAMLRDTE